MATISKKNIPRRWKVLVSSTGKKVEIDKRKVKALTSKILNALSEIALPPEVAELSILFTGNDEIQALNRDYRHKNKATDVLSFSQLEGAGLNTSLSLGDIVISLEFAKAQAAKLKVQFGEEVLRLLIHGVLHLHGFDHENVTDAERRSMKRREKAIFESLKRESKGMVHG